MIRILFEDRKGNGMIDSADFWTGEEVKLPQMLDAREYRAYRQYVLLKEYHLPLLCFTMNIAGPVKKNLLVEKGFDDGRRNVLLQMERFKVKCVHEEIIKEVTGCEAYYVAETDPYFLKKIVCELEDYDELGRLYDLDVLYMTDHGEIRKIDREEVGSEGRKCLLCGRPAKECSSRRIHSVPELQRKTSGILMKHALEQSSLRIAEYAVRALLYEVCVTPKPGLVDRRNSGSHTDMDIYTFLNSSASLYPYFMECAGIGQQSFQDDPSSVFEKIREAGKKAEREMLRASNGVNTHKGAVFTMGLLAAASGRISIRKFAYPEEVISAENILDECARMTAGITEKDFAGVTKENALTAGQKLFAEYGIAGVRGQMEAGLPAVRNDGLPLLKQLLSEGKSNDEAGYTVLLKMIAVSEDTNLIHRGSIEVQRKKAKEAEEILAGQGCPSADEMEQLDSEYIKENLSPGGSADLLAACWYLYFLESEGE